MNKYKIMFRLQSGQPIFLEKKLDDNGEEINEDRLQTITIDESQRQIIMLAIARLSDERPGWEWTLRNLAKEFQAEQLYDDFRNLEAQEICQAISKIGEKKP